MEIENPKTASFIPLDGTFNFEYERGGVKGATDVFSFGIDWTKGGVGQEILRECIGSRSLMRVSHRGVPYQGVFDLEWGINTANGRVFVRVA